MGSIVSVYGVDGVDFCWCRGGVGNIFFYYKMVVFLVSEYD